VPSREMGDFQQLSLHRNREPPLSPLGSRKRAGPELALSQGGTGGRGKAPLTIAPQPASASHPRRSKARAPPTLQQPPPPRIANADARRAVGGHPRLFDPQTDDPWPRLVLDPSTAGSGNGPSAVPVPAAGVVVFSGLSFCVRAVELIWEPG
jgi:hypothetical protein